MDYIWIISILQIPADAGLIRTDWSRSRFRHTAGTGGSLLEIKSNLSRHGRACSLDTSITDKIQLNLYHKSIPKKLLGLSRCYFSIFLYYSIFFHIFPTPSINSTKKIHFKYRIISSRSNLLHKYLPRYFSNPFLG